MKITCRIPTEQYAYVEVEFTDYQEFKANLLNLKAEVMAQVASASLVQENNELPWDNEPTYTPPPVEQFQPENKCKKCYSEMTPGKNGKPYCKKCYIAWANANKK